MSKLRWASASVIFAAVGLPVEADNFCNGVLGETNTQGIKDGSHYTCGASIGEKTIVSAGNLMEAFFQSGWMNVDGAEKYLIGDYQGGDLTLGENYGESPCVARPVYWDKDGEGGDDPMYIGAVGVCQS